MRLALDLSLTSRAALQGASIPAWITAGPTNRLFYSAGDSRTANDYTSSATTAKFQNLGLKNWAAWKLKQRIFRQGGSLGIGGESTAGLLARFDAVLAGIPAGSTIKLMSGVNDRNTSNDFTLAQSQANMTAILDKCFAKKVFPIIGELPRDTGTSASGSTITQAQNDTHFLYNEWLRNVVPVLYKNVRYSNTWDAAAATIGASTQCKSGFFYDGLHLNDFGAFGASQADVAVMSAMFDASVSFANLATSNADQYNSSTASTGVLVTNPLLTGTSGTVTGAAGTVVGTVPTGWALVNTSTGGLTINLSQGTDSEGFAEFVMAITGTPTTANAAVYLLQSMTAANLNANDNVSLGARVAIDAGNSGVRGVTSEVRLTGTTSYTTDDMAAAGGANTGVNPLAAGIDGYQLAPPAIVPAGTLTVAQIRAAFVQMDIGVPVSATVRLGRISPRKTA